MITSIPTAARGKVRAFLKGHPNFDAFAANLGVESRNVLNADLLVFAANENLMAEVAAIIAASQHRRTHHHHHHGVVHRGHHQHRHHHR